MAVKKATIESPKAKRTAHLGHDEILKRAEELYQERLAKNLPGTEEGDWLEAEKQLMSKK